MSDRLYRYTYLLTKVIHTGGAVKRKIAQVMVEVEDLDQTDNYSTGNGMSGLYYV